MADDKINRITLAVVTPYKDFYEGEVYSATLQTPDGALGIMAGHSPMIVALNPGIVDIRENPGDEMKHFVLSEGYAEIGRHKVLVVANAAEWPSELNVESAIDSYTKARVKTAKSDNNDVSRKAYQFALMRSKVRINAIKKYGTPEQQKKVEDMIADYGLD